MAAISWKSNTSGFWDVAANWSTGTVPGAKDDVTISTAAAQTITHNTGTNNIASLYVASDDTLAVTGGTLTVLGIATIYGNLTESAGTMAFAGGASQVNGTVTQKGGTLDVTSGTLVLNGAGDTFAGTFSGAAVDFAGGSDTLEAGVTFGFRNILLSGATLTLDRNLTQAGIWDQTAGTISLGSKTLTLSGQTDLNGGAVIGGGSMALSGATQLSSYFFEGSTTISNTGTVDQTGYIYLGYNGTDTPHFTNEAGATYRIDVNNNIYGTSGALFDNAGNLIKAASGLTQINVSFTNTGSIDVASGVLRFDGATNSFKGTVSGAGTLELSAGADTFQSGLRLTVGHVLLDGGALTLGANLSDANNFSQTAGTLDLAGHTLTASGSANLEGGIVSSGGTIAVRSAAVSSYFLEGNAVLNNTGTLNQTGYLYDGYNSADTAKIVNAVGATYLLDGSNTIYGTTGSSLINSGTFMKNGGTGASAVNVSTTSTGTIDITSGTLSFAGASNSFSGTLTGGGVLELNAGTDTIVAGTTLATGSVLLNGATLTIAGFETYAGSWSQTAGALSIGSRLTLSGPVSLEGGVVTGAGTLALSGATALYALQLEGSATISNTGTITQDGNWYLGYNSGDTSKLVNQAGAKINIIAGAQIFATSGSSFTNTGALTESGGNSQIQAATINTGTVNVASGSLTFAGPVSGSGHFSAGAGTTLGFSGAVAAGGQVTLGTDSTLSVNGAAGFGDTINGFAVGDVINLQGVGWNSTNSFIFNANTDKLEVTNGSAQATLQFAGSYTASSFRLFDNYGTTAVAHT